MVRRRTVLPVSEICGVLAPVFPERIAGKRPLQTWTLMSKYDASLKLILRRWGSLVVERLTGEEPVAWKNVEFPNVTSRYADLLVETASGVLWHIELQTVNDREMPVRMLEYATHAYRNHRQLPEQCVLYVGREPMRMESRIPGGPGITSIASWMCVSLTANHSWRVIMSATTSWRY